MRKEFLQVGTADFVLHRGDNNLVNLKEIKHNSVLFTSYSTLATKGYATYARVCEWLGASFDGVVSTIL